MNIANAMVGNSSSGIIEAPSFGLPVVNIGSRQDGRQRSTNVIDVGYNRKGIKAAIKKALYDEDFKRKAKECKNPYGNGSAGKKIVQTAKSACEQGLKVPSSTFRKAGSGKYKLLKADPKMSGKSIQDISTEIEATIVLVYDNSGKCYYPEPTMKVMENCHLLLFGEFLKNFTRSDYYD